MAGLFDEIDLGNDANENESILGFWQEGFVTKVMPARRIRWSKLAVAGTCEGKVNILDGSDQATQRLSDVGSAKKKRWILEVGAHEEEGEMRNNEKFRFRGTVQKTAVPCGFRDDDRMEAGQKVW